MTLRPVLDKQRGNESWCLLESGTPAFKRPGMYGAFNCFSFVMMLASRTLSAFICLRKSQDSLVNRWISGTSDTSGRELLLLAVVVSNNFGWVGIGGVMFFWSGITGRRCTAGSGWVEIGRVMFWTGTIDRCFAGSGWAGIGRAMFWSGTIGRRCASSTNGWGLERRGCSC